MHPPKVKPPRRSYALVHLAHVLILEKLRCYATNWVALYYQWLKRKKHTPILTYMIPNDHLLYCYYYNNDDNKNNNNKNNNNNNNNNDNNNNNNNDKNTNNNVNIFVFLKKWIPFLQAWMHFQAVWSKNAAILYIYLLYTYIPHIDLYLKHILYLDLIPTSHTSNTSISYSHRQNKIVVLYNM